MGKRTWKLYLFPPYSLTQLTEIDYNLEAMRNLLCVVFEVRVIRCITPPLQESHHLW